MKFQKYIVALILVLCGFGIFFQYDAVKPNQEIVIQFQGDTAKPVTIENAVATVKQRLKTIGVTEIVISERIDGAFKISYFSDYGVDEIERLLSENSLLQVVSNHLDTDKSSSKTPEKDQSNRYLLKIFEIQKTTDAHSGLSGNSIIVQKSEIERFLNPNYPRAVINNDYGNRKTVSKQSVSFSFIDVLYPVFQYYIIPETRAGPLV
ncbi:MAG: hypothetical protein AAF688_10495 [Bacteroidota bacterium]